MVCQRDSIVHPDTVLVVSEWWRHRLAEDFGVAAQVVHNGVDLRHFTPPESATARQADRTRLGLNGRAVVLSVGGVEPRNNTLVLLEAFVRARPRIREATGLSPVLVIAGGATLFDYREYRDAFEREVVRDDKRDEADARRDVRADAVLVKFFQNQSQQHCAPADKDG